MFGPPTAKSFDDESISDSDGILSEAGIIPRALRSAFNRLNKLKMHGANVAGSDSVNNYDYEVRLQFLELYGEDVYDLLASSSSVKLSIRDGGAMVEPEVIGATELKVASADDALLYLTRGALRRVTGATAMNPESSRSHAIITLIIEQTYSLHGSLFGGDGYMNAGVDAEMKRSKFHFVDLAGSERQKRSLAAGLRLKEGININKGLLVLGNVISALGDPRKRGKVFVPYRDSKLTRLLKGSLGGNHKTLMVACVSPSSSNMEETLNCLRYANRAKNIQNKAVLNTDTTESSMLFAIRNLLKALANELLGLSKSNEYASRFSYEQLVDISQGKITLEGLPQILGEDTCKSYQLSQIRIKTEESESAPAIASVLSDVSSESGKRGSKTQDADKNLKMVKKNLRRGDPSFVDVRDDYPGDAKVLHPMSQTIAMEIDCEHSHLQDIAEKYLNMTPDIHVSLSHEPEARDEVEAQINSAIQSENGDNGTDDNAADEDYFLRQNIYHQDISALAESIATKEEFIEELERSQQKYDVSQYLGYCSVFLYSEFRK